MNPGELLLRYAQGERDFRNQNLSGARITEELARSVDLVPPADPLVFDHADFSGSDFSGAYLRNVYLNGAHLRNVDLRGAYLSFVNLQGADLTRANLLAAYLRGGSLSGATLTGALLGHSVFTSLELSDLCNASLSHLYPSCADFRSISLSLKCPGLRPFLLATGLPEVFVDYTIDCALSLDPRTLLSLMRSTFISYGTPDEAFAAKLNAELRTHGVTTFFFRDDAKPGTRLSRLMHEGVNDHDRTILICSKHSLNRPGLLNELVETLAREARDGGEEYLIPIRLDDFIFEWAPQRADLARALQDRVIADFSRHEDPACFREAVERLLSALRRPVGTIGSLR
jgi:hypothetical protein